MQTLEIVGDLTGNVVVKNEVDLIKASVSEGKGMAAPLEHSTIFPALVRHMLAIGEKTGMVDEMMDNAAQHYETEVRYALKNLTAMIEPLLTVVLGALVLTLALSIFLPMWNIVHVFRH
jgi:type II secretory pathway component PulF